ncbi:MAG TPA: hypothetical protein VHA10_01135 [Hypericibacter adhaerens]|jgi:hypothetical protein|nr:hypothetical protein [Hypericibacter adhaerens]HWA41785.1 hypothetical protein [Hypericibacter adhaerens]
MKKILLALLAFVISAVILPGCASQKAYESPSHGIRGGFED